MVPNFYQHVYAHTKGIVTLASCTQNQRSYESESLSHSLFTYFLINALKGDADHSHKGFVTLTDVFLYLADKVPGYHGPRRLTGQTPNVQIQADGELILNFYRAAVDGNTTGSE